MTVNRKSSTKIARIYKRNLWGLKFRNVRYGKLPGKQFPSKFSKVSSRELLDVSGFKTFCKIDKPVPRFYKQKRIKWGSKHATVDDKKTKHFIKSFYHNIRDKTYRKYEKKSNGNLSEIAVQLEHRLDTLLYRVKWAKNLDVARHLICHGKVSVNGFVVKKPSFHTKVLDLVELLDWPTKHIQWKQKHKQRYNKKLRKKIMFRKNNKFRYLKAHKSIRRNRTRKIRHRFAKMKNSFCPTKYSPYKRHKRYKSRYYILYRHTPKLLNIIKSIVPKILFERTKKFIRYRNYITYALWLNRKRKPRKWLDFNYDYDKAKVFHNKNKIIQMIKQIRYSLYRTNKMIQVFKKEHIFKPQLYDYNRMNIRAIQKFRRLSVKRSKLYNKIKARIKGKWMWWKKLRRYRISKRFFGLIKKRTKRKRKKRKLPRYVQMNRKIPSFVLVRKIVPEEIYFF